MGEKVALSRRIEKVRSRPIPAKLSSGGSAAIEAETDYALALQHWRLIGWGAVRRGVEYQVDDE